MCVSVTSVTNSVTSAFTLQTVMCVSVTHVTNSVTSACTLQTVMCLSYTCDKQCNLWLYLTDSDVCLSYTCDMLSPLGVLYRQWYVSQLQVWHAVTAGCTLQTVMCQSHVWQSPLAVLDRQWCVSYTCDKQHHLWLYFVNSDVSLNCVCDTTSVEWSLCSRCMDNLWGGLVQSQGGFIFCKQWCKS